MFLNKIIGEGGNGGSAPVSLKSTANSVVNLTTDNEKIKEKINSLKFINIFGTKTSLTSTISFEEIKNCLNNSLTLAGLLTFIDEGKCYSLYNFSYNEETEKSKFL